MLPTADWRRLRMSKVAATDVQTGGQKAHKLIRNEFCAILSCSNVKNLSVVYNPGAKPSPVWVLFAFPHALRLRRERTSNMQREISCGYWI